MNTYRVKVQTTEIFEIDAVDEEQAATDWFDGSVVSTGEAEVLSVKCIDIAESSFRYPADKAAGAIG